MSNSTRGRSVRGKRDFPKGRRLSTATPRRFGFSEEAGLWPGQFKLLIDENPSPALVSFARRRGFPAAHVNEVNLRTAADKHIARYAIDNGMVLVTNNVRDFKRIYSRRKLHPGLIFLQCTAIDIFTEHNQATLLGAALDDVLQSDLLQEAILISLKEDTGAGLHWDLTRQPLPDG